MHRSRNIPPVSTVSKHKIILHNYLIVKHQLISLEQTQKNSSLKKQTVTQRWTDIHTETQTRRKKHHHHHYLHHRRDYDLERYLMRAAEANRNPGNRITRPERHLCSVWQASCVIYDSVMRQHSGQLEKGYSSRMRLSWLLSPWEDEGSDAASGDIEQYVNGIHKRDIYIYIYLVTLSEVDSDVCVCVCSPHPLPLLISDHLSLLIIQIQTRLLNNS